MRPTLPRPRRSISALCLAGISLLFCVEARAQFLSTQRQTIITRPTAPYPRPQPGYGGGLFGGFVGGGLSAWPIPRRPPTIDGVVIEEEYEPVRRRRPPTIVVPLATQQRQLPPSAGGARKPPPAPRQIVRRGPTLADLLLVPDEVLFEVRAGVGQPAVDAIARSLRLSRLSSQRIDLIGSTIHRYRISDGRQVSAVVDLLRRDPRIASAQGSSIFHLQQGKAVPAARAVAPARKQPTPGLASRGGAVGSLAEAQYALTKMRLPEAHRRATGEAVTVAVIDSMIDAGHPELAGSVTASFDPVGGEATPHTHGTGIAGIIAAHGQLTGVAPKVRILAIRAFASERGRPGADGTTLHIVRGLDFAAQQGAQVVNMSFAGPQDDLLSRGLAAARQKGMVLVAASGNAGPKSKPLYPAADVAVIAVSATDADDKMYPAANRGPHICVTAPGVDIVAPAPGGAYQLSSGTSMAAAHVSGAVALLLQARAGLTPDAVREALVAAARDLGPAGQDDDFGAGFTDAFAILTRASGDEAVAIAPAK